MKKNKLKLNAIQLARLAIRRAFAKENLAEITYTKKSDETKGSYIIDMNFVEDLGEMFNTYTFATSSKQGSHWVHKHGGIRSFYKNRIEKIKLV